MDNINWGGFFLLLVGVAILVLLMRWSSVKKREAAIKFKKMQPEELEVDEWVGIEENRYSLSSALNFDSQEFRNRAVNDGDFLTGNDLDIERPITESIHIQAATFASINDTFTDDANKHQPQENITPGPIHLDTYIEKNSSPESTHAGNGED